jgi:hypothetical protein
MALELGSRADLWSLRGVLELNQNVDIKIEHRVVCEGTSLPPAIRLSQWRLDERENRQL